VTAAKVWLFWECGTCKRVLCRWPDDQSSTPRCPVCSRLKELLAAVREGDLATAQEIVAEADEIELNAKNQYDRWRIECEARRGRI